MVDDRVEHAIRWIDRHPGKPLQVSLSFFEKRFKQAWFSKQEERLYWEQWKLNLRIRALRQRATSTSGEDAHPPTKKQTSRRLGLRPLGAALKRRVRFLSLRTGKEEAVRGAWPSGPAAPFPSPLDAWVAGGPHLLRTTTLDSPEVPAQLPNSAVLDEWVNSRLHLAAPGRL